MKFSSDFAGRLKNKLPAELHAAVDLNQYVEIATFLGRFLKFFFSPEAVKEAFLKGRERQDLLAVAYNVLEMRELYAELEAEWNQQSCSLRTRQRVPDNDL